MGKVIEMSNGAEYLWGDSGKIWRLRRGMLGDDLSDTGSRAKKLDEALSILMAETGCKVAKIRDERR